MYFYIKFKFLTCIVFFIILYIQPSGSTINVRFILNTPHHLCWISRLTRGQHKRNDMKYVWLLVFTCGTTYSVTMKKLRSTIKPFGDMESSPTYFYAFAKSLLVSLWDSFAKSLLVSLWYSFSTLSSNPSGQSLPSSSLSKFKRFCLVRSYVFFNVFFYIFFIFIDDFFILFILRLVLIRVSFKREREIDAASMIVISIM